MVRPKGIDIVIVVVVKARNSIIRTSGISGVDIRRRGGIVSRWNGAARTIVDSGERADHLEAALLMRQAKLALPFQQCRIAVPNIQFLNEPRTSPARSHGAHFWLLRFVRACL